MHPERCQSKKGVPRAAWDSAQVTEGLSLNPSPPAPVTFLSHLPSCVSEDTMAAHTLKVSSLYGLRT